MALFTVYLIGYGNEVPDDFLARLELAAHDQGCLVLDIRAKRRSWAWSYTGPQVEFIFKKHGHDYIWLSELGNCGNGRGIQLVNEEIGMMALERLMRNSSRPVVLMCAERLSQNCHRRAVADKLADRLGKSGDQLEIRPL